MHAHPMASSKVLGIATAFVIMFSIGAIAAMGSYERSQSRKVNRLAEVIVAQTLDNLFPAPTASARGLIVIYDEVAGNSRIKLMSKSESDQLITRNLPDLGIEFVPDDSPKFQQILREDAKKEFSQIARD